MGIALVVTLLFHANVDAQGGAYATGVLILITSAAIAVTISVWGRNIRWLFLAMSLVFIYTTILNIKERPEGIKIASVFILAMIVTSLVSRALRSTELRICGVHLDSVAQALLDECYGHTIRLVPRRPKPEGEIDLDAIDRQVRYMNGIDSDERIYFFEVEPGDTSDFEDNLAITGERLGKHRVLRAKSPVIPNAIAALLIYLESTTGNAPHAYFKWREGNPISNLFAFLFFGEGDAAPITHEVLRRAVRDPRKRPVIHVS
jgi:hypothetical protein